MLLITKVYAQPIVYSSNHPDHLLINDNKEFRNDDTENKINLYRKSQRKHIAHIIYNLFYNRNISYKDMGILIDQINNLNNTDKMKLISMFLSMISQQSTQKLGRTMRKEDIHSQKPRKNSVKKLNVHIYIPNENEQDRLKNLIDIMIQSLHEHKIPHIMEPFAAQ